MKIITLLTIALLFSNLQTKAQDLAESATPQQFPALPYAFNALEPAIDAATVELHYSKHHQGYYDKLVAAIKNSALETESLKTIFSKISTLDASVRNNGGGFYNHVLYWENMQASPQPLSGVLEKAIVAKFGSVEIFKEQFNKASLGVFGSGWTWLILDQNKQLQITTTPNQDNPLMDVAAIKGIPLLALDVWEHAYYLKYQNKRASYIDSFWKVVNWNVVTKRYEKALK